MSAPPPPVCCLRDSWVATASPCLFVATRGGSGRCRATPWGGPFASLRAGGRGKPRFAARRASAGPTNRPSGAPSATIFRPFGAAEPVFPKRVAAVSALLTVGLFGQKKPTVGRALTVATSFARWRETARPGVRGDDMKANLVAARGSWVRLHQASANELLYRPLARLPVEWAITGQAPFSLQDQPGFSWHSRHGEAMWLPPAMAWWLLKAGTKFGGDSHEFDGQRAALPLSPGTPAAEYPTVEPTATEKPRTAVRLRSRPA